MTNQSKAVSVGLLVNFSYIHLPVMVTVFSPLQNLTFEDIHAVRSYEKAWVLRLKASQTSPRSVDFLINYWLYASLCTSSSSTCTRPAGCTCFVRKIKKIVLFCFVFIWKHFCRDGWIVFAALCETWNKNLKSKCLSLLWCINIVIIVPLFNMVHHRMNMTK